MASRGTLFLQRELDAKGQVQVADGGMLGIVLCGPERDGMMNQDDGVGRMTEFVDPGLVASDLDVDGGGEEGLTVVADAGAESAVSGDWGETEDAVDWPTARGIWVGVERGE